MRIRGEALFYLTSIAAALDGFTRVAVGIGIVTASAFGIGITAVPTPVTDIEWEGWMFHWIGALMVPTSTLPTEGQAGSAVVRVPIDSKAMRKVGSDETIFGCVEVAGEVGTSVMGFNGSTRLLIKLP